MIKLLVLKYLNSKKIIKDFPEAVGDNNNARLLFIQCVAASY